jgi:hypothetical protein
MTVIAASETEMNHMRLIERSTGDIVAIGLTAPFQALP